MFGEGSVQEGSSSNRKRRRNLEPAELKRNCVSRRRYASFGRSSSAVPSGKMFHPHKCHVTKSQRG